MNWKFWERKPDKQSKIAPSDVAAAAAATLLVSSTLDEGQSPASRSDPRSTDWRDDGSGSSGFDQSGGHFGSVDSGGGGDGGGGGGE